MAIPRLPLDNQSPTPCSPPATYQSFREFSIVVGGMRFRPSRPWGEVRYYICGFFSGKSSEMRWDIRLNEWAAEEADGMREWCNGRCLVRWWNVSRQFVVNCSSSIFSRVLCEWWCLECSGPRGEIEINPNTRERWANRKKKSKKNRNLPETKLKSNQIKSNLHKPKSWEASQLLTRDFISFVPRGKRREERLTQQIYHIKIWKLSVGRGQGLEATGEQDRTGQEYSKASTLELEVLLEDLFTLMPASWPGIQMNSTSARFLSAFFLCPSTALPFS